MHTAQYITVHAISQQTSLHNTTLHTKHGTAQQRTSYHTPHTTAVQYSTAYLRTQIITTHITVNNCHTPQYIKPNQHNAISQNISSQNSKEYHTTLQFDSILHKQQHIKSYNTRFDMANLSAQFVKVNYRTSHKIIAK